MRKVLLLGPYSYVKEMNKLDTPGFSFTFDIKDFPDSDYIVLIDREIREVESFTNRIKFAGMKTEIVVFSSLYNPEIIELHFPMVTAFSFTSLDSSKEILLDRLVNGKKENEEIHFTPREKKFLHQLSFGLNFKEISTALSLSERSVRRIKDDLYRKTGVNSIQQLMVLNRKFS